MRRAARTLARVGTRDWVGWHSRYDDPASEISQRLVTVRARIRDALAAAPPGPIPVVSICAGDGRDLLGAMAGHDRAADVRARLVELDPRLVERGRAASAGTRVEFVEGDAARTDLYAGAVPAKLVLACGIFGNITDDDIARTVAALPAFTEPGGTVVWTRHRREPDLFPVISSWFERHGFEPVWLSEKDRPYGVGVHRYAGTPQALVAGQHLFTFTFIEPTGIQR
jgi:Putative methyltransferase